MTELTRITDSGQKAKARRVFVIFNPTAGRLRRRKLFAALAWMRSLGCKAEVYDTRCRGDAEAVAASLTRDAWDVVVAAGGDGTVNEVVNGLVRSPDPPALAFLPLGTANVLAHEIGLGGGPEAIGRCIAAGSERPIHLGVINDRHFVLMAGVGLDAHVVENVKSGLKKITGKLAYVAETLAQVAGYPFPTYHLSIDGVAHEARAAVVCNARHYGGGYVVAPAADLSAPSFEVLMLARGGWWHTLRYAVALAAGHLPRLADVTIVTGREVVIAGPGNAPVQGDGDVIANLPVTIRVSDHSLRLLVPC